MDRGREHAFVGSPVAESGRGGEDQEKDRASLKRWNWGKRGKRNADRALKAFEEGRLETHLKRGEKVYEDKVPQNRLLRTGTKAKALRKVENIVFNQRGLGQEGDTIWWGKETT